MCKMQKGTCKELSHPLGTHCEPKSILFRSIYGTQKTLASLRPIYQHPANTVYMVYIYMYIYIYICIYIYAHHMTMCFLVLIFFCDSQRLSTPMNLPGPSGIWAKRCSKRSIWELWARLELLSIGRMCAIDVPGTRQVYLKIATQASYRFLSMAMRYMHTGTRILVQFLLLDGVPTSVSVLRPCFSMD